MSDTDALEQLRVSQAEPFPNRLLKGQPNRGDQNTSSTSSSGAEDAQNSGTGFENGSAEEHLSDNSVYPEVRASVSATDNVTLSISTPRMWILTLIFALLGSSANLFFSLRYPSVTINPIIALIVVHPVGLAWDLLLKRRTDPREEFRDGFRVSALWPRDSSFFGRWRLWLAQGRWNEKEHACVYIGSNVAFAFAFATDIIVEQKKFYRQEATVVYQLLLTISTQILGYAFAGMARRYLVKPPSMIWPGTLASTAMFATLHKSENKVANGWRITRWRFFVIVWSGSFLWYFLPGLLMPALSYFNVLTWFAPDNVVVANLFGVSSGLGLFPITFDWAQLAYIGSPLLTPWWAAANVFSGLAIVMWIIAPILYYRNTMYSAFMPLLSSSVFDNRGNVYNVSRILTPDFLFDEDAFNRYSPIYLPVSYFLSYAVQFAGLTALVTHTLCWYGRDMWDQSKQSFTSKPTGTKNGYQPLAQSVNNEDSNNDIRPEVSPPRPDKRNQEAGDDIHNRLMERYEDAPIGWYIVTLLAMLAIGLFVVE